MTIADKVALELLAKALYDDQNTLDKRFYNWNVSRDKPKWRKRAKELIDEQPD